MLNRNNDKPNKTYFLKDEAIKSLDDDKFRHQDVAHNLRILIETNNPPFNVAIIGKWGLGKSSLINMVIEPLKKDSDNYLVQEINAWKYEKESLCKVFLKQLWQSVKGGERIKSFDLIKKEVSEILELDNKPDTNVKTRGFPYRKLINVSLIIFGLTFFALFVYKIIQGSIFGFPPTCLEFLGRLFLSYCKNIATVLVLPILIAGIKMLLDQINEKQTKKIELNFPLETADDYEIMLEAQIKSKLEENPKLKVVTVIDDLDRLSLPKIVEALDALKTFINLDRCIFIVPFDDTILKNALVKARLNSLIRDNVIVESELVLDKLFQFKLYIPPLLDYNIKKYAVSLCLPAMKDFVNEYCQASDFEKVLRYILIHNDVKTPRQVKKLVNIFAANLMVAIDRENKGKLSPGFATTIEGKYMIAVISVLQADFNEFYDLLFKNASYLRELPMLHKKQSTIIPNDLLCCFNITDKENEEGYEIKDEYLPLVQFLIKSEKYVLNNMLSYLYVAQDEISVLTGDETQQKFIAAINSGDLFDAQKRLNDSPDLAKVLENHIINTDDVSDSLLAYTLATVNLFDIFSVDIKKTVIPCLAERMPDIISNKENFEFEKMNFTNLFDIFRFDKTNRVKGLISAYFDVQKIEQGKSNHHILSTLPILLSNESLLLLETIEKLKACIDNIIKNNAATIVKLSSITSKATDEQFMKYFGMPYFSFVCSNLDSQNDFSTINLSELKMSANKLIEKGISINEVLNTCAVLFEYPKLIPILSNICNDTRLEELDVDTSNTIVNRLVEIDISSCSNEVVNFLSRLPYVISENNSETFNTFFGKLINKDDLEQLLNNFCKNGNELSLIPNTIAKITESIFKENDNDATFKAIEKYYTVEQKNALFAQLTTLCAFVSNKNYEHELKVIEILYENSENHKELTKLATSTILPTLSSRYNQASYVHFSTSAIDVIIAILSKENIDNCISSCNNAINYFPEVIIGFYGKIADYFDDNSFTTIAPLIIQHVDEVSFDDAYLIFIKKENTISGTQELLNAYTNLLINKFELSHNPEVIIQKIIGYYSKISKANIIALATKIKNSKHTINTELSQKLLTQFIDSTQKIEDVIEIIIQFNKIQFDNVAKIIKQLKKHTPKSICQYISENTGDFTASSLTVFIKLFIESIDNLNVTDVVNILKQIFIAHDDVTVIENICTIMSSRKDIFGKSRQSQIEILYPCFHKTTSEIIKKEIVATVQNLGMLKQFKTKCTDDEEMLVKNLIK